MTVILVLVMFLGFVILDWILHRGKQPVVATNVETAVLSQLNRIAGFFAPDDVRYHAGHAWLQRERRNIARTGADEFAAALAGNVSKIELPKPGQWVRQGQKAWTLHRNGETTEMVSRSKAKFSKSTRKSWRTPRCCAMTRMGVVGS